ncbi:MAG: type II toxin-antitoxin system HicA family toxin [Anaerolineae bacterium]|nr:type II toxin-antitoxin system HicA family toxin [Anaerolineae bacterium]
MPKLRRLNGSQIIKILEGQGFEVVRIRGSHYQMQRATDDRHQNITVPVHGKKPLAIGTVKNIYRDLSNYIPEEDLQSLFYTD